MRVHQENVRRVNGRLFFFVVLVITILIFNFFSFSFILSFRKALKFQYSLSILKFEGLFGLHKV